MQHSRVCSKAYLGKWAVFKSRNVQQLGKGFGLKFLIFPKVAFDHTLVIEGVWFMTMFTRCGVKSKLLSKLSNCSRGLGLDLNPTMQN